MRAILFDLDGTLTDPKEGITNSVAYALEKAGIPIEDKNDLITFIGPPLADSFAQFYGFNKEQCDEAIKQYRVYFKEKGILENKVYPGIKTMLQQLKEDGRQLRKRFYIIINLLNILMVFMAVNWMAQEVVKVKSSPIFWKRKT